MNEILKYFSANIRNILQNEEFLDIEEIRLRVNKPIILKRNTCEKIINYNVNIEDILQTLELICDNSIYSFQNQICNGFITICGGHRVGIVGTAVMENEKVVNINYISNLNFRIAREVIGCSNILIKHIVDKEISNTLIVSPPGGGKTTILRDLVRNISNNGKTVGVVDERGEIAAMYKGIAQNNLGIRTDIIENIPKQIGIKMLVRSMTPDVVVADEIGNFGDVQAIKTAICLGVKGIFTAHGNSLNDIKVNPELNKLFNEKIIEKIVFLKNKKIEKILVLKKETYEYNLIEGDKL